MSDNQFELERLHQAAADGDLSTVTDLLKHGYDVNAVDRDLRYTPLHYAAKGEHLDVVKSLIDAGADVNTFDKDSAGDTPLGYVAQTCSLAIAELLLRSGANPLIPGMMQVTPLMRAERRKKPEGRQVFDLMLNYAKTRYHYHHSS
jgi:ankyrin repeat protein